jgi:hypothetical protein
MTVKKKTSGKKAPVKAKKAPAKAKKVVTKAKKTSTPTKKVAKAPRKAAAKPKRAPAKPKKTSPQIKKAYSVSEFSEMTYLTPYGVNEWLKQGKLQGKKDNKGNWQVDPASLQLPIMKKLVR